MWRARSEFLIGSLQRPTPPLPPLISTRNGHAPLLRHHATPTGALGPPPPPFARLGTVAVPTTPPPLPVHTLTPFCFASCFFLSLPPLWSISGAVRPQDPNGPYLSLNSRARLALVLSPPLRCWDGPMEGGGCVFDEALSPCPLFCPDSSRPRSPHAALSSPPHPHPHPLALAPPQFLRVAPLLCTAPLPPLLICGPALSHAAGNCPQTHTHTHTHYSLIFLFLPPVGRGSFAPFALWTSHRRGALPTLRGAPLPSAPRLHPSCL